MAPAPPPVAKIAVESRGDVLHLVRQLKAAARTRAEQQGLKGRAQEELESMLDAWVDDIFKMAGPNISVNGFDYDEAMKDKEEYEPKDERLDKLITDRRVEAQAVLERVITQRRTVPPLMAKLAEDAERRKTWNEAEAIVFAGEKPVQGEQPDLDVEEMIEEVKEAAEAVREMSVTVPALESKLANAATVMRDMGLLPLKARDSVGGLVRAEDDEPPTPRRAVSGMVRKLRGSDVGLVDGMEVDETED